MPSPNSKQSDIAHRDPVLEYGMSKAEGLSI